MLNARMLNRTKKPGMRRGTQTRSANRVSLCLVLAAAGGALCMLAGCHASFSASASPDLPSSTVSPVPGSPIKHVVVIMQENRSFDNLFNGFPGADTAQSGSDNGVEIPLKPVPLDDSRDLLHSHPLWWKSWHQGQMDGFAQSGVHPETLPYSYVPRKDVEPYWDLALQYTLGDRMFQANTGPSFVAHQYMIAGQSGDVAENPTGSVWGCDASRDTTAALIGPNGTVLPGIYPCFDYHTLADLLNERGITWRYYAPGRGDTFFILSAYQAIRHIRFSSDWHEKVVSPPVQVLTDIKKGQLAQVTWIVPDWKHSDHPGSGNEGPDWVASVVNAIGNSPFWDSTAIFISWDDWGGWYDHVEPPRIDAMGPGFRVPVIVVSPYARHGYVSHQFHEVSGILAFIEENFGLPDLGARDAATDDFNDCFDYRQAPAAFTHIRTRMTPEELLREPSSGPPDDD